MRAGQHQILEAGPFQIEKAAEAAEIGIRSGALGRACEWLNRFNQGVACVDIDTGIAVGYGLGRRIVAMHAG